MNKNNYHIDYIHILNFYKINQCDMIKNKKKIMNVPRIQYHYY